MSARILVAEDDPKQANLVRIYLERDGHDVLVVGDGRAALDRCRAYRPDLVVLDVMMPLVDGLDVCRILRSESDVPIVLLTARSTEDDKLLGLDIGADDYVTKPYSPRELAARIRALLRRSGAHRAGALEVYAVGELEVDVGRFEVRIAGRAVGVTAKEFAILQALAAEPGRPQKLVATAIGSYRFDTTVAACLVNAGSVPSADVAEDGTTRYRVDKASAAFSPCTAVAEPSNEDIAVDHAAVVAECGTADIGPTDPGRACLERVFAERLAAVAPSPVQVRIGVPNAPRAGIAAGPIVAAAGAVAVIVLLGAFLLSRRVLRPIDALTRASARLGAGDLGQRVPALGGDEMGRLGRAFNDMAERLERSEQRQRQLVSDVAHELRTPLVNLRGYLEALKDGVIIGDPALFASLHEEAMLQTRIVDDLQDLTLAEAGQLAYHREPVELAGLVESCVAAQQPGAQAAGVSLCSGSPPGPAHANVDPDRLRQVVANLIRNALAATPSGGRVTVTTRLEVEPDRSVVVVDVSDTGRGIAPDDLPHVFDRFWRADHARGRASGGAGLGLAIVRQIVADHNGTATVESELGVGSTFTVRLPLG